MQTEEFFLFDTVNTITAPALDPDTMTAVKNACLRYEKLFSRFDEQSQLFRINTPMAHRSMSTPNWPSSSKRRSPTAKHQTACSISRWVGHAPVEFQEWHHSRQGRRARRP